MDTAWKLYRQMTKESKFQKGTSEEIKKPKAANIHTPDNHVDGKKTKTVDGKKGLGDRKTQKPSYADNHKIRHLGKDYTGGPVTKAAKLKEADKPKVEKKEPAHTAKVGKATIGKKPSSDIKAPKNNKEFMDAKKVKVDKIEEGVKRINSMGIEFKYKG